MNDFNVQSEIINSNEGFPGWLILLPSRGFFYSHILLTESLTISGEIFA